MVKLLTRATNSLLELWIWLGITLLIAAAAFSYFEQISFWNSLYWACVTATSTGYGDISPKTVPGKLLSVGLMFMALFFILPLMIGRVYNAITENKDAWTHDEQSQLLQDVAEIKAARVPPPRNRDKTLPFDVMDRRKLAAALWYITGRNVHGGQFDKTAQPEDSPALSDTFDLADEIIRKISAETVR